MDKKIKIASENKVASENTIKNALINFDVDFNGLKEIVACFIPTMRDEMVLRYKAETIAKIGLEAYRIAQNENIKINPIPPKIALPLIEKMSLEHEQNMYERWARLLIAAGVNPNPIHQQYADILANLNNLNAIFLRRIYEKQPSRNTEKEYEEYIDKTRFQQCYDELQRNTSWRSSRRGENEYPLPDAFGAFNSYFRFPLIIFGTEKSIETLPTFLGNGKAKKINETVYVFTKEENDTLIGLEKLGLIKGHYLHYEHKEDEDGNIVKVKSYGVLLTQFGHSFVDCLEHPI